MGETEPLVCYLCPGDSQPVSRAIHLGRLARFYPPCRTCPHRDDTGSLSSELVEQLTEIRLRTRRTDLFDDETLTGVECNELDARTARQVGLAFGDLLLVNSPALGGEAPPCVVLAGDSRPLAAELIEAVAEGLRYAGCDVVDIGGGTSALVTSALERLPAIGGLLVGNVASQPHTASMKFWAGGRPLSRGAGLESLAARIAAGPVRSVHRAFGNLRRFQATAEYLEPLVGSFHALRPLQVGLDCASRPLARWLGSLSENSGCRFHRLEDRTHIAHCGVWMDGDGERLQVYDERHQPVSSDELLATMACFLLADQPGRTIVLEEHVSPETQRTILRHGGQVVLAPGTRFAIDAAMRKHAALLAGGPSGRFWFAGSPPLADALRGLSLLLVLLSATDRPLSEVVSACYDRAAA